jgi:hypothetical protein
VKTCDIWFFRAWLSYLIVCGKGFHHGIPMHEHSVLWSSLCHATHTCPMQDEFFSISTSSFHDDLQRIPSWEISTAFCSYFLQLAVPIGTHNSTLLEMSFWGMGSTEIWTQGLMLDRQILYHLHHSSSPFCFSYFSNSLVFFVQASLDPDPPIYASRIAGITGTCHHISLIGCDGVSLTFCPG